MLNFMYVVPCMSQGRGTFVTKIGFSMPVVNDFLTYLLNNLDCTLCFTDDPASATPCSRPVSVPRPHLPSTSTPGSVDPAVAGPGSSVLSDAARQAGRSPSDLHRGQDASADDFSSFNSSTLRSKSSNSRIRKQPEMPPRRHGQMAAGGGVRWLTCGVHVILLTLLLTVATSHFRCQRLTC